MKIPKEFKLFQTTIKVVWNNKRMNDVDAYGYFDYSKSEITLGTTDGVDKLSSDRISDCFYHEKVHSILESMRERDLSKNEQFVDVFAKLLRQSDETAIF